MNLIQQIKIAMFTKYQTSTLWTADAIPFYLDHAPQSKNYPIIACYHVSTHNTMAMVTAAKPAGFDYCESRFQLKVFGNDKNHVQIEDIMDRVEDLFHRQSLPMALPTTHIATFSIDGRTSFWDVSQKIWILSQDFKIFAGK